MNIKARKYSLIQYLIELQDENILKKIESTVQLVKEVSSSLDKITSIELIERANKANKDFLAGRFLNQNQLENESSKW